jgi:tetratricopeptide (TPR) repeat protein
MTGTRTLLITGVTTLALTASAFGFGADPKPNTAPTPGSGSTNSNGAQKSPDPARQATPDCPKGYVLKNGACTQASSGVLPDDQLYTKGRALALSGYYAEALPILEAIKRTDNSMVYTMRGFTLRKLGRYQEGVAFYDKAFAIDPNNVNTHEYMGEYYVEIGKIDLARTELAKVEKLCGGSDCEQYEDLAEAIETGKTE